MASKRAIEKHYRPMEVAKLWGIDPGTVRRIFVDKPGVLRISNPDDGRRTYTTIRIPESLLFDFHAAGIKRRGRKYEAFPT